jgi:hypothetical protein
MKNDQRRSIRLEILRKAALRLHAQGKSVDFMLLSLKSDITRLGVCSKTAKDYYDTVVGKIAK